MLTQPSLARVNRIASLAILPMMTLVIVVFSRFAGDDGSDAAPPTAGTVVVANLRVETLSFIDLATGGVRELVLPGPPHEMVESGGRIYVTLGRGDALVEVEPRSAAILRVLPLEGEPHGIAAWGDNLVVTLDKANAAVVLDRASLTEIRRYPTGDTPHVIAVSGEAVLVTDSRSDALRQLEPGTHTIRTGGQPEGLAIAGGYAATADYASGTLTVAKAGDLSAATTLRVGAGPVRVTHFDGSRVLVAIQGTSELALVDLAAPKVERRVGTGARPDGICVAPGGGYAGVASNEAGWLDVFATGNWGSSLRLDLEPGIGACLWLGAR